MLKQIIDITHDWTSELGGLQVGKYIDETFSKDYRSAVALSFSGIDEITPAFINGAFLYMIDIYGDDFFDTFVTIKDAQPAVENLIISSVQNYKAHRHDVLRQFNKQKIYCAIDSSGQSIDFQYRLFEAAQNKGFHFYFNPDAPLLSKETWEIMGLSHICIGVIAQQEMVDNIMEQMDYALNNHLPCILLCNKKVTLPPFSKEQEKIKCIYYSNYFQAIKEINKQVIEGKNIYKFPLKKAAQETKETKAILGLLASALLLYVWATLFDEK